MALSRAPHINCADARMRRCDRLSRVTADRGSAGLFSATPTALSLASSSRSQITGQAASALARLTGRMHPPVVSTALADFFVPAPTGEALCCGSYASCFAHDSRIAWPVRHTPLTGMGPISLSLLPISLIWPLAVPELGLTMER